MPEEKITHGPSIRRLPLKAFIAGAALFLGIFVIAKLLTKSSPLIIVGSELSIVFIWRLVRAMLPPISAHPTLRIAQVLLALPVGAYAGAFLLAGFAATSRALWLLLGGFLFYVGVSRRYVFKLKQRTMAVDESRNETAK